EKDESPAPGTSAQKNPDADKPRKKPAPRKKAPLPPPLKEKPKPASYFPAGKPGHELRCFQGHGDHVFAIRCTRDGRYVLSAGKDKTVRLWSVVTGKELHRHDEKVYWVICLAISPDGRRAVTGGDPVPVVAGE